MNELGELGGKVMKQLVGLGGKTCSYLKVRHKKVCHKKKT